MSDDSPTNHNSNNVYQAPESELVSATTESSAPENVNPDDQKYRGLGGWLILVGLGVVVSPFRIAIQFFQLYVPLFADGSWDLLTDPESDNYLPYYDFLLISEMFFNCLLFLLFCYLNYLFFTKHYKFPRIYTAAIVISILFILIDAWVVKFLYLPDQPMMDTTTLREMMPALFSLLVWVPYLHLSKRSKQTFVEKKAV